jgi:fumarate reductase flavoprotein subunit
LEVEFLHKAGGSERVATIREEMQKTIEVSAGIYRKKESLTSGGEKLRELQQRFANINLDDRSRTFNTELEAALELGFMLDVAESIVHCALARTESRGAHQRTDFPARNDQDFLAHSLVYRDADGSSRIEYFPVRISRWAPGERVYGDQATDQPKETPAALSSRRAS